MPETTNPYQPVAPIQPFPPRADPWPGGAANTESQGGLIAPIQPPTPSTKPGL